MQKQLEGTQKYINEPMQIIAHIDGQLITKIIVSNTHALQRSKCLK